MKKDLAIAMAVAKKNKRKMMAEGGPIHKPDTVVIGDSGFGKIIRTGMAKGGSVEEGPSEKENQSGVNKIVPNYDKKHSEVKHGHSSAGTAVRQGNTQSNPKTRQNFMDTAKARHENTLQELKSMPKPKLQGLAEGGMVESKIINPRKVDALGQVLKNKEAHLMSTLPPEDETEHLAYDDNHALHSKQFAKGGMINEEVSMDMAENDELEHPAGLEMDNDMMKPSDEEIMANHFAEGGEVLEDDDEMQPEPEAEDEDHASIAAAIMSKRAKFAAGGMVDIDSNNEEQSNMYYKLNRAALKENFDSDMDSVSQPMDSNEHGDSIDADEHDRISIMRRKMALKRMAK